MATVIPARVLRNDYRKVIERVRSGERITVTADGEPVVDLIPHQETVPEPPQFRSTGDLPRWTDLSEQTVEDWLADIRGMDDFLDQTATDPWDR